MNTCKKCGETKEDSLFKKNYKKNGSNYLGPTNLCKACEFKDNKIYIEKNREVYNTKARDKRNQRKKEGVQYKGGACEHCKEVVHIAAFDFHHVDASTKEFDPGLMGTHSKEKYFAELDKCILLCANCHRIEHFNNGY